MKIYNNKEKAIIANLVSFVALQEPTEEKQKARHKELSESWDSIYKESENV